MPLWGAVLLSGGRSRRMGADKAALSLGGEPFLRQIARELESFPERLLSVDRIGRYELPGWKPVEDLIPGCGPLGGMYSALRSCSSEALLVATCDIPLYRASFGQWLLEQLEGSWDAVVPVTADGIHPLCAVYRKRCMEIFQAQIEGGRCRVRDALEQLRVRYVDAEGREEALRNVNTPEDYRELLKGK